MPNVQPVATVTSPNTYHALAGRCDEMTRAGQLEDALTYSRELVVLFPNKTDPYLRAAKLLTHLKRETEAEGVLRAALPLTPPSAQLQLQLGIIALHANHNNNALIALALAAELDPTVSKHHALLAQALFRANRLEEAVDAQRRAIALDHDDAKLHAALGGFLVQIGQVSAAISAYQQSLLLKPNQPVIAEMAERLRAKQAVPSGAPQTAVEGSDGFLFHEVNNAFEQICGDEADPRDVERLLTIWQARQAWCQVRDIDYRVLIVPERHVLYADKLPAGFTPHPDRMALRLMRALDPCLEQKILYPIDALIAGRARSLICYREDVHWTHYGAYLAYRALLATIPCLANEIIDETELTKSIGRRVGDMAIWMDRRTREQCEILTPPSATVREIFSTKSFQSGQVDVFETDHPSGRRLVLFRTSNSTALLPLLLNHFSRIVAVATTAVHFGLLASENPHVVISELPERYLAIPQTGSNRHRCRMPRDFEAEDFSEATGCKLPLPGAHVR